MTICHRRCRPRGPHGMAIKHSMMAVALLASLGAGACSWRTEPFTLPGPENESRLESEWAADRTDPRPALQLAGHHLRSNDVERAEQVLQTTYDRAPGDPALTTVLALTEHRLGQYGEADRHLAAALESARSTPLESYVRGLRAGLRPQLLRADAEARVAAAGAGPSAALTERRESGTVILPFSDPPGGADSEPLAAALAAVLADALSSIGLDPADPAEARAIVRALGRPMASSTDLTVSLQLMSLTGADRLVSPAATVLPGGELELSALVVTRVDGATVLSEVSARGAPSDLMTVYRRLAMELTRILVGPDPRYLETVAEVVAAPLDATLEYGRGLLAWDEGRLADANAAFRGAVREDGEFALAALGVRETDRSVELLASSMTESLVDAARQGERIRALRALTGRERPASGVPAGERTPGTTELLGQDLLGVDMLFDFILALPSSGN